MPKPRRKTYGHRGPRSHASPVQLNRDETLVLEVLRRHHQRAGRTPRPRSIAAIASVAFPADTVTRASLRTRNALRRLIRARHFTKPERGLYLLAPACVRWLRRPTNRRLWHQRLRWIALRAMKQATVRLPTRPQRRHGDRRRR